ncbi:MAG: 50S ribosomal protein L15 [candidate division Zixibacteria bacterium]|nr:50S ribosomal protein L15 [candidate division Zixibacteria bacterium]
MNLHNLKPSPGAKKKRKRLGRGPGSGWGKTAGRGHKGQLSRSGYSKRPNFEGGQTPLHRRLPKFGFTNIFRKEYQIVNLADLGRCEGTEITPETLKAAGLVKKVDVPVKILGNGSVDKAYMVKAAKFSKSAQAKLEEAGGKTEVV